MDSSDITGLTRRALLVALAATCACGDGSVTRAEPGMHEISDRIRGLDRTSHVYIPSGLVGPAPMVVVMHDLGVDALSFAKSSGWMATCDARGWVGIFPENDRADYKTDNTLIAHLIRRVAAMGGGDMQTVFLVGHGAGGRRAYAFIASNAWMVRAIGTWGAPVRLDDERLGPQDPTGGHVCVLHLHGERDGDVPIAGGPHRSLDHKTRQILPLDQGLAPWIAHLGAREAPFEVSGLPTRVELQTFDGARPLVRAIDPEGDHAWPDYATAAMADFFAKAPPPDKP